MSVVNPAAARGGGRRRHSGAGRSRGRAALLVTALAGLPVASCGTPADRALVRQRQAAVFGPEPAGRPGEPEELPALTAQSTAEDYVRYGLLRNPSIRAAFERWRAAIERIPQVSELPDPNLTFGHFVEEVQTRTGPQRNRFGIRQTLPWFGKLGQRGEVAAAHAESLWWRLESRRRDVVRAIRNAFFDYAYLAQEVRITGDLLALLQGLEPIVQRRVQTGASQQELLQLQVEIGKLEDALATLQSYRPALSARLSALLARPQWSLLPFPELAPPELQVRVTEAEAEGALQEGNPDLKELAEVIRRTEANRQLAELEGLPDFTIGVDYIDTGSALVPGTPGSGDDPWALTLGLNLPIYRGRYSAMQRQADAERAAAREQYQDKGNSLRGDLRLALYRLDDALRKVRLYRDTLLPRARQSLQVTETAYRAGNASLLDLIDRQRVLLAFEQSYWRACADHGQARADLEALTGGLLR